MNLCNLARLCMVNYTATTIFNPSDAGEDEDHRRILLLGLKAQARELQQHIKAAFSLTREFTKSSHRSVVNFQD